MGIGLGVMHWEEVRLPKGVVAEFAREMLHEGIGASYMWGQSQGYAPFTQRALLELLDRFAQERGLSRRKRGEIRAWLKSLPWVEGGWRTRLPKDDGRSQAWGYHPLDDNDDRRDGGLVELHFSW